MFSSRKKLSTTSRPREQIFDGRGQEAASRYALNPGVLRSARGKRGFVPVDDPDYEYED
jgi:hypothetical protein